MMRYAIAVVLLATIGTLVNAQQPGTGGTPPPGPGLPPPKVAPGTTIIPITTGSAHGFYKSGGVLVGANGLFPFDTGDWLLGGTDGLTRSTGFFYIAPPTPYGTSAYATQTFDSAPLGWNHTGTHRFFHRH